MKKTNEVPAWAVDNGRQHYRLPIRKYLWIGRRQCYLDNGPAWKNKLPLVDQHQGIREVGWKKWIAQCLILLQNIW